MYIIVNFLVNNSVNWRPIPTRKGTSIYFQIVLTAAGIFGIIVSQAIGAVLIDMYFLKPFLGAKPQKVVEPL